MSRAHAAPILGDPSRALTRAPGRAGVGPRWLGRGSVAVGTLLGFAGFLAVPAANAAQPPVGLGSAGSFAVLAGSGITNTGPTTITGDVGTFPTPSETGFGTVTLNGTNHDGDGVTQGAKNDLVTAYNDAAGRTPATSVPVQLGGSTLFAGVYRSPSFGLTGTLTLDAQHNPNAEFIFQASSTLIAETNSRVVLLNGADPCHVAWQVGSS
ncbi:MAG TPA: ice-binding family protein, partial [Mycobacteriales bacterium]|nr:ice-binding family protein [Mycobacteriales bacterium]